MHSVFKPLLALALSCSIGHDPATATPTPAPPTTLQDERVVWIPFDPPIGEPIRYRMERIDERNGTTRSSISTVTLEFRENEEGFRAIVTPVSYTSSGGPDFEVSTEIQDLFSRPYTLLVGPDGEILGVENADEYWAAIVAVVETNAAREVTTPEATTRLAQLTQMMRDTPAEARLAFLTDRLQPLLSYASLELAVGERLETTAELPSMFGGTVESQVFATLERVDEGIAHISGHTSLSRESMLEAMERLFARIGPPENAREGPGVLERLRGAERMSREIRETYQVSLSSGLTERYRSTDETDFRMEGEVARRVRVLSIERID